MNTATQLQRMSEWLDTHPETHPRTRTYADDLDEQTLRRSHLSMRAARDQRRPKRLVVDEYGRGNDGRWYPGQDGAA